MKSLINTSSLRMIFSILTVTLIITGCGESDPDNEGNHIPDVKIVQKDKTVNVGTKVDLAVIAADIDKDKLSYQWSFSSKPSGSTATLNTATKLESSFNADLIGEYKVKFVATDALDAKGSDTITITAINVNACTSYTTIDADIDEDTTFDGCYKITRTLLGITHGALLTVKPGSTLLFLEDGGINIDSGAIKAVGTVEKPILFTGEQKVAGSWNGIHFRGVDDARNEIAFSTIEYAGDNNHGALVLEGSRGDDNQLKLSNTTIKHSSTHGFYFEQRTKLNKFENITSTKNTLTAGVVHMMAIDKMDSESDFTGNIGGDYITVKEGDVEESATWKQLTVPLLIERDIEIGDNAILTLNAGSTLVFDEGKKISTGPLGALKAIGTSGEITTGGKKAKPILFTGKQKNTGYWAGIVIGSDNTDNIIENASIEYAGSGTNSALRLNTHFSNADAARMSVTSSTFSNNSNYAIEIDDDNEDAFYNKDIESSNTFVNNEKGSIFRDN